MIAEFLVKVGSIGLKKAKQEVTDLGASVENVGAANKRAELASRAYFDTQAKGVIGVANSTKSFSKLAQTMGTGGSSGLVGAYATLAANIFAASAAFNALRNAAQMEQVERGLEALGARTGQTLTTAAKGLKEISGNTLTMEQSMRSAAQVFSAGFGSGDLERIGRVANDVSVALGRNMTDSMDRLTRGVIKLEPELLDELGIMTRLGDAVKVYALETGKSEGSLSTVERRQAFLNAVLAEGEAKFGGLADAAGNTRGYDSMASALQDLTKVALTTINTVLLPLAGFLGGNPAVMAGGVLLFASTLKDQILPGMSQMAERSQEIAQNFKEAQTKEINDIIQGNRGDQSAPMDRLATRIEAGTAGLKDYKKAQQEITDEYRKTEAQVIKYNKAAADSITPQRTAIYNQNLATLRSLRDEYNEVTEALSIQTRTTAEVRRAEAMQAAAVGNTSGALRLARVAGREYYEALEIASGSTGGFTRATNIARAAAFSFGTTIKIVGAGILSALPYIGLAVVAIGLLKTAFDSLKSAEDKLVAEKAKQFSEVYIALGDKLKELRNINESSLLASQRTTQAITLETNAIIELADRYSALRDAKIEADGSIRDGQDIARWWETFTTRNRDSNFMQIDRNSEVLGEVGRGLNKEQAQALEALRLTAPQAYEAMKRLNGGAKEFAKLPVAERARLTAETLEAVAESARSANSAVSNFTAANKEAGDALTQFMRSAMPSTSFDGTVNGLNALTNSIAELQRVSYLTEQQVGDLITGLSQSVTSSLSLDSARFISDTKTVEILENQLRTTGELSSEQERLLTQSRERLRLSNVTTNTIVSEVQALRQRFIAAQEMEISLKSQNDLISATLKANQENYSLTVEGLNAQINAENAILNNQIAQLENARSLLQNQVEQRNQTIQRLELEKQSLAITYQREVAERRARKAELEFMLEIAELELQRYDRVTEAYNTQENYVRQIRTALSGTEADIQNVANSYLEDNAQLEQSIATAKEENRVATLSINNYTNQIAATSLGIVSSTERTARLNLRQLQIVQALEEKFESIANNVFQIQEIEARGEQLRTRGRLGLDFELRAGREKLLNERQLLENERRREVELNRRERELALVRGNNAEAQQAAARLADTNLTFINAQYDAQIQLLEAQTYYAELEKVIFDTRIQGIEWQKESLSLIERQVQAQNDLVRSNYDLETAQNKLERARRNFGDQTPAGREADQIRAATVAYEVAVQESEVKKSLIQLEFALLEAQQIQLRDELEVRRAWLASNNTNGQFNTAISQIERVTRTLSNVDYSAMARSAMSIIDNGIEIARANLETSLERSTGRLNSAAFDISSNSRARADAQRALATVAAVEPAAAVIANSVVEPLTQTFSTIDSSTNMLVDALNNLRDEIRALRSNELTQGLNVSNTTLSSISGTPQQVVRAVGNYLQSEGLRISEADGFGGVTPGVHRGRGHAEGRAIDVNIGRGNIEYNNPEQRARFDSIERDLIAAFGDSVRILWGPAENHLDHMHIEFARTISRENTRLVQQIIAANDNQIETKLPDIIVEAPRIINEEILRQEAPIGALRPATNLLTPGPPAIGSAVEAMIHFEALAADITQHFRSLGPEGEAVLAAVSGISLVGRTLNTALESLNSSDSIAVKFTKIADVASASIATIQSVLAASTQARVEGIDKEIAAEQKRDGKSSESLAKIQSLEKKKDQIARKSFETNKKLQMAQAIISTASAVAGALAMQPAGPWNIPIAMAMGALGAAQLAIIAGTQYQSSSSASNSATASSPTTLSIGRRGDSVDLATNNRNAGGEIGYLRGQRGIGSNAGNYSVIGSAYGGPLPRGYGNAAFVVGEKGPEIMTPEVPMNVRPINDNNNNARPTKVEFNINTLDASGVEEILLGQRGNIIGMLRDAANANGQTFLEDVNTNVYTKPNVGRL